MRKFEIGDSVLISGGFGKEPPEIVIIENTGEKKGKPVYDYTDTDGNSRWFYEGQIIAKCEEIIEGDRSCVILRGTG